MSLCLFKFPILCVFGSGEIFTRKGKRVFEVITPFQQTWNKPNAYTVGSGIHFPFKYKPCKNTTPIWPVVNSATSQGPNEEMVEKIIGKCVHI